MSLVAVCYGYQTEKRNGEKKEWVGITAYILRGPPEVFIQSCGPKLTAGGH